MSQYKGIFLDLDNTLYDYHRAHHPAMDAVVKYFKQICTKNHDDLVVMYNESRSKFNAELEGTASSHNRLLYFQYLCERLEVNPLLHALESYHLYWDVYIENIRLFDGVLSFLGKNQNKPIVIVTDLTADIQHKKIHKIGISQLITHIVTSEEVGAEKPSKKIFQLALNKCGLNTENVCMIGDNFDKDIVGAQKMGINSFWLNRSSESREHNGTVTEIKAFNQLLELI